MVLQAHQEYTSLLKPVFSIIATDSLARVSVRIPTYKTGPRKNNVDQKIRRRNSRVFRQRRGEGEGLAASSAVRINRNDCCGGSLFFRLSRRRIEKRFHPHGAKRFQLEDIWYGDLSLPRYLLHRYLPSQETQSSTLDGRSPVMLGV
jgi:hypothetical protein